MRAVDRMDGTDLGEPRTALCMNQDKAGLVCNILLHCQNFPIPTRVAGRNLSVAVPPCKIDSVVRTEFIFTELPSILTFKFGTSYQRLAILASWIRGY
jgi:hypothetical protein